MALGTITVVKKSQVNGINFDRISFNGDGAYPAGGTPAFQALVRTALAKGSIEIIHVVPEDCGGYVPIYDTANDKLKVYYGDNNNAADGPMVENATANLSAVPFNLTVVSK